MFTESEKKNWEEAIGRHTYGAYVGVMTHGVLIIDGEIAAEDLDSFASAVKAYAEAVKMMKARA